MNQFKCLVKAIYHQHNGIYGAHKIHAILINKGYAVSVKYVQKIMRLLGIMSVTVKKFKHYTKSKAKGIFNNILNQDFKALEPNKKWVADITYIHTKRHGWCYLSSIIDLYSRKVIAHKLSKNMSSQLVIDTLNEAKTTRNISHSLIIHTDLGTQYLSKEVRSWLSLNKIHHSFSRKGCPYDNSVIESFHAALKKEEVYLNNYDSFEEAKIAIFKYIEGFYNQNRIHSTINYLTPNEFEKVY